tara:strand:+ start:455 stop:1306 length:852 start_codon:yes stop_codon:yes gene_type:complete
MSKLDRQLKFYFVVFVIIIVVPVIIAQGIFEQWGVLGCLAPLVGCGGLIGLLTLLGFKEDNGDTKISFEPPARDEESHEMAVAMVRQMVGKQIRLVSVHWSESERDEYLYTPDIEHSDKRRRAASWMDEPTKDILSKSRYMVESVKGEEDQIRLASVHWSHLERYEYLYSPNIDYSLNSEEMREVTSWMVEPTEDILSKSRYMVEPVPGQEDEIRLVSVHWSDPERYEYLYTSRQNSGPRREIKSWKVEPTNDILSKSRYRVEFVLSSKEEETEEENWWEDEK